MPAPRTTTSVLLSDIDFSRGHYHSGGFDLPDYRYHDRTCQSSRATGRQCRGRRNAYDRRAGQSASGQSDLDGPSFGGVSTIFCLPSMISARKLARSISPFWSQLASIRMPGAVAGTSVSPFMAAPKALRSNFPIFSVTDL